MPSDTRPRLVALMSSLWAPWGAAAQRPDPLVHHVPVIEKWASSDSGLSPFHLWLKGPQGLAPGGSTIHDYALQERNLGGWAEYGEGGTCPGELGVQGWVERHGHPQGQGLAQQSSQSGA